MLDNLKTTEMEKDQANSMQTSGNSRANLGSSRVKLLIGIVVLSAIMAGAWFAYQNSIATKDGANVKDRPIPVTVATSTMEDVPLSIRSIGNVLPFSVVNVVPQVSGQLKKVYFTQGQQVHKGDLLFLIDPSPYQAALAQAKGNVQRDSAQIDQAQANYDKDVANVGQLQANLMRDNATSKYAEVEQTRYKTLEGEGAVSREQSDQTNTNAVIASATIDADKKAVENAQAVVRADKAAIQTAKGTLAADQAAANNSAIQLSWTQIRSPLDGRTGSLNVYEGNVVTANAATPLVTIDQIQPIYVTFTVPEQNLDEVRKNMQANTLVVEALVEGKRKNAVQGQVSFLENTVNTSTGTITLRAAFANTELRLFPGQFVDVIVTMPSDGKTVVVPTQAIQTTQQGSAVYMVTADNKATLCPVEVARTSGDKTAITKGLGEGVSVVTDGQMQLTPGAKVKVVTEPSQK